MTTTQDQYCMKWNNYQAHIGSFFANLLESETLVDVTLCAEGHKFHCHRVILSACSTYFQEILANAESKHPIILLPGISALDVKSIIDFIYHGELNNINYDRFSSILKTAETLKICGLMEVIDHLPSKTDVEPIIHDQANYASDVIQEVSVIEMDDSADQIIETVSLEESEDVNEAEDNPLPNDDSETKPPIFKRKQRKEHLKKYSEGSFSGALSDMMRGMSLGQAAKLHKIPRSTLYAKAKQYSGLNLVTRREHSNQECHAAIQAISAGMSLQKASEEYGIPKTVLWRRVQKRLDLSCSLKDRRKSRLPPHVKEAAINALTSGEKLVNVSAQYQIPVSTLLKEKSRLVECGTLNPSGGSKILKHVRLSQAVAACQEGKMSQAAASTIFQVPKTTIWRRLQKLSRSNGDLELENDVSDLMPKDEPLEVLVTTNSSDIIKVEGCHINKKVEKLLPILTTERVECSRQ